MNSNPDVYERQVERYSFENGAEVYVIKKIHGGINKFLFKVISTIKKESKGVLHSREHTDFFPDQNQAHQFIRASRGLKPSREVKHE